MLMSRGKPSAARLTPIAKQSDSGRGEDISNIGLGHQRAAVLVMIESK